MDRGLLGRGLAAGHGISGSEGEKGSNQANFLNRIVTRVCTLHRNVSDPEMGNFAQRNPPCPVCRNSHGSLLERLLQQCKTRRYALPHLPFVLHPSNKYSDPLASVSAD